MKIPHLFFAILASISPANGTPVAPVDPPFSAERIEQLSQEIRRAVVSRCRGQALFRNLRQQFARCPAGLFLASM
jgi:hypothetical protein